MKKKRLERSHRREHPQRRMLPQAGLNQDLSPLREKASVGVYRMVD